MKNIIYLILLLAFITACDPTPEKNIAPSPTNSEHLVLGNPSNANTDIQNPSNYLMIKPEYALSYNSIKLHANWVAWTLSTNWIGSAPRQDDFRSDTSLPQGWYRVRATDYSGSGFDRGHFCPSADRTRDVPTNSATFLMTNMMPQAPNNNQQTWGNLEDYTRSLIASGNVKCYIYAGAYGTGGIGSNGTFNQINSINVPNRVWKIIVVLPSLGNPLENINTATRIICVDMPNIQTINSNWRLYRTSVRALETATGYNFLNNIPQSLQDVLEPLIDNL